jgi:hypothetical protein
VASALVGVWTGCPKGPPPFSTSGPYAGTAAPGVEFTSDGHFFLLSVDSDWNEQGIDKMADQGTFAVVDASSTLGPGEYQVRFTANDGEVSLSQVDVFASPPKLRFFGPQAADFSLAQTWKFRAGICGPSFVSQSSCVGQGDPFAPMVGRWLWCSGEPDTVFGIGSLQLPGAPYVGIDIHADTTFNLLVQDDDGGLVPASPVPYATVSGTLQLGPSDGQSKWTGINPGAIIGGTLSTPLVDACGRAMLWDPTRICDCSYPNSPTCHASPCPVDPSRSQLLVRQQ